MMTGVLTTVLGHATRSLVASFRSVNVNIRVRPRELKTWRAAADRADETLSEWIRMRLNLSAVAAPRRVPRSK